MLTITLRLGDSLEVLKELKPGTIGSVCTDPPYGLEFMGKEWDAPWKYGITEHGYSDGANRTPAPSFTSSRNPTCQACGLRQRTWKGGPEACSCDEPDFDATIHNISDRQKFQAWCHIWLTLAYNQLPSGGVIKVFGGTRMFHRMAQAMVEAGFVRIGLEAWCFGSGFPKSLNLSKAIDRHLGKDGERPVVDVRTTKDIRRNVAADTAAGIDHRQGKFAPGSATSYMEYEETAAATDEARQFEGWGTALKPAWEPFIVGYKP